MFKTPQFGCVPFALALLASPCVAGAPVSSAGPGVHALDSRADTSAMSQTGFSVPTDSSRPVPGTMAASRTPGVEGGSATDSGALPLAQFARGETKPGTTHGEARFRVLVARVRDGGLPEPASWALMLIGFGMIGGALRGFIVANRRLAGLQPEDADTGPRETGPLEPGPLERGASEG